LPETPANSGPIGFASVDAEGVSGTTGGLGGETVRPKSYAELAEAASGDVSRIIEIDKTFSGKDIQVGSNKTITGVNDEAMIKGFGFQVTGQSNIIIHNLRFEGGGDDAINITSESHHVWIDHCSLRRYGDGLIDIKHGSSYVTVSWNHFQSHRKTCLLGHSNRSKDEDVGRLKVTYHHNWFDNTDSRHPRVRFGESHVFNNYYVGNGYGIASTCDAKVLVEANFFRDVVSPTRVGFASSWEGELVERDNIFESSGDPETMGQAFEASAYYNYQPYDPQDIPEMVQMAAGAGKEGITLLSLVRLPLDSPFSLHGGNTTASLQFMGLSGHIQLIRHRGAYRLDGKSVPGCFPLPDGSSPLHSP
jgi:pectate lyase